MKTIMSLLFAVILLAAIACDEKEKELAKIKNPVICEGSYTIRNADDLYYISKCNVITGNLIIRDQSLVSLAGLDNLKSVKGRLIMMQ